MIIDPQTLAAFAASRICHDLVSPVAALTTALDVMDDEGGADMREQALGLIRNSVATARAKLEFLRAAFGSPTIGAGEADMAELRRLCEQYAATAKPELVWTSTETSVPRAAGRIVVNLVMIAIDCLARGGTIEVTSARSDTRLEWRVAAAGRRAALKDEMRAGLKGDLPEGGFDGRSIQSYLTFLAAAGARAELAAREEDERVELIARIPLTA